MPLNKAAVGREGEPGSFEITAEKIQKYALATNEANPLFLEPGKNGGKTLAPPCFAFTYSSPGMAKVLFHKDLGIDFVRLVHGEQEFKYHAPAWSGQTVSTKAKIAAIETKDTGETFTIESETRDPAGKLLTEARFLFFIRGKGSGAKKTEEEPARKYLFQTPMVVAPDQPIRYGNASGDTNPIHMNEAAGKAAGLGGIILHGLCTLAFASKALVDGIAKGDTTKLRRLGVRFSKPVRPGDTVTTRVWEDGPGKYGFDAVLQDGTTVLKNGGAEFG